MKKRKKSNNDILIDLNERGNIRIIRASKKTVSNKNMQKFEQNFTTRYNSYCEFTDLCIKHNIEKNQHTISKDLFNIEMENMLEQNSLLKNLLKQKKQNM